MATIPSIPADLAQAEAVIAQISAALSEAQRQQDRLEAEVERLQAAAAGSGTGQRENAALKDRLARLEAAQKERLTGLKESGIKISVQLKGKDNYLVWASSMTTMLKKSGLQKAVEPATRGHNEEPASEQERLHAMYAIKKNVHEDELPLILDIPDDRPDLAWSAIQTEYSGQTGTDLAMFDILLSTTKLKAGADLTETKAHLTAMRDLGINLARADPNRTKTESDMATKVLISLPYTEYKDLVNAMLRGPIGELTQSKVRAEVLAQYKRGAIERGDDDSGSSAAMTTTGFSGKCFNCGKAGHRAADCRSRKKTGNAERGKARNGKRKGGKEEGGSASIALLTSLAGVEDAPRKGIRDFIVDNAATCGHVSTHKAHFEELDFIADKDRPTIGGIGPQRIKVHARGNVRLKLANGKSITLTNVAYAPDASANIFAVRSALLQLGKDGKTGAEHHEQTRSARLLDGAGRTIVTSTVRKGLYYLDLHKVQDFE